MTDVVLIPCYDRPEFLYLVLEYIKRNKEAEDLYYLFCVDYDFDPDVLSIIEKFPYEKEVVKREPHNYDKLSYNIMVGYKKAASITDRYVYMIESDVFVSDDFFNWHHKVQQDRDLFCSIAIRNHNSNYETSKDLEKYYTTDNDYASVGVCFQKDILKKHILPHITTNFFHKPQMYIKKRFKNSQWHYKLWTQQAGLIRRIQEKSELPIAFPHVPRAFHAGFYGSNRPDRAGNLRFDVRLERVKRIAFDEEKLRRVAHKQSWVEDSLPQNLDLPRTGKVVFDGYYS